MWQEYAIEPTALVRDWPTLQRFADGMGWDTGRLLAAFPSKTYRRSVWDAIPAGLSSLAYSRFEERLRRLLETAALSLPREFAANGATTWLQLAKAAHAVRPFHAVIALSADGDPTVVSVDDLDKDEPPWKCIVTVPASREPEVLAKHCELLCAEADEISIIDPFYDLADGRILTALEAFVDVAPPIKSRSQRFSVHLKATELTLDPAAFESKCRSKVSPILRSNQRVTVFLWSKPLHGDRFHDRHVLSSKGGVVCPGGADGGPRTETTTLSRHSDESRSAELAKFDAKTPAFTLIRQFEVK